MQCEKSAIGYTLCTNSSKRFGCRSHVETFYAINATEFQSPNTSLLELHPSNPGAFHIVTNYAMIYRPTQPRGMARSIHRTSWTAQTGHQSPACLETERDAKLPSHPV